MRTSSPWRPWRWSWVGRDSGGAGARLPAGPSPDHRAAFREAPFLEARRGGADDGGPDRGGRRPAGGRQDRAATLCPSRGAPGGSRPGPGTTARSAPPCPSWRNRARSWWWPPFPWRSYVAEAIALGDGPLGARRRRCGRRPSSPAPGCWPPRRGHARARVCDHAHCQVLLRSGVSEHRPRSRAAAEATRGRVLLLPDRQRSRLAVFHAACGGRHRGSRPRLPGRAPARAASPSHGRRLHPRSRLPAARLAGTVCRFRSSSGSSGEPSGSRRPAESVGLDDRRARARPGKGSSWCAIGSPGRFGSGDALARASTGRMPGDTCGAPGSRCTARGHGGAAGGAATATGSASAGRGAAVRARRGETEAAILGPISPMRGSPPGRLESWGGQRAEYEGPSGGRPAAARGGAAPAEPFKDCLRGPAGGQPGRDVPRGPARRSTASTWTRTTAPRWIACGRGCGAPSWSPAG